MNLNPPLVVILNIVLAILAIVFAMISLGLLVYVLVGAVGREDRQSKAQQGDSTEITASNKSGTEKREGSSRRRNKEEKQAIELLSMAPMGELTSKEHSGKASTNMPLVNGTSAEGSEDDVSKETNNSTLEPPFIKVEVHPECGRVEQCG